MEYSDRRLDYTSLVVQSFIYIFVVTVKYRLAQASLACVAGVRKGRGRELGRETTREGGVIPVSLARRNSPFPFPF